jgi:hypothetical protein
MTAEAPLDFHMCRECFTVLCFLKDDAHFLLKNKIADREFLNFFRLKFPGVHKVTAYDENDILDEERHG